nr:unnamed protein product [Spirometra erinaceieuropaei]
MDHRLVIPKIRLRLQPRSRPQGKRSPGKLNTDLLNLFAYRFYLNNQLTQHLKDLPASDVSATVEARFYQQRDAVFVTTLGFLGRTSSQNQDCFDEGDAAINNLLVGKKRLHRTYLDSLPNANKAAFYQCCRLAQQPLREMQDAWMAQKTEEIQDYAGRNESKKYFAMLKVIYGPTAKETAPLLGTGGTTLLIEKSQILKRWSEHCRNAFNRPSTISAAVIDRLPQVGVNIDLNLLPSIPATIRAVQKTLRREIIWLRCDPG